MSPSLVKNYAKQLSTHNKTANMKKKENLSKQSEKSWKSVALQHFIGHKDRTVNKTKSNSNFTLVM